LKKQEELEAAEQLEAVAAVFIPLDADQGINPFHIPPVPEFSLPNFGTSLRPSESKYRAPKGLDKLKAFIMDLQDALVSQVLQCGDDYYQHNQRAQYIQALAKEDSAADQVIVPTDKTNSFVLMDARIYKQKVLRHLLKDGKEIPLSRLVLDAHEQAAELFEDIDRFCSKGEHGFFQESFKSCSLTEMIGKGSQRV
jgi:hypothetical protein